LAVGDLDVLGRIGDIQHRLGPQHRAHGLAQAQALAFGRHHRFFMGIQGLAQLFRGHRHPAVLDQRQPLTGVKETSGFFQANGSIAHHRGRGQIQQGIQAQQRGAVFADAEFDAHPGRPPLPPVRDAAQFFDEQGPDASPELQRGRKPQGPVGKPQPEPSAGGIEPVAFHQGGFELAPDIGRRRFVPPVFIGFRNFLVSCVDLMRAFPAGRRVLPG
jgi:hypothetical protein